jgi:hypothetical protein
MSVAANILNKLSRTADSGWSSSLGVGQGLKVYKVLVGTPKAKRPFRRPRNRREDEIRMDLREIGWGSVDWI